jgi:hypothetical protein
LAPTAQPPTARTTAQNPSEGAPSLLPDEKLSYREM